MHKDITSKIRYICVNKAESLKGGSSGLIMGKKQMLLNHDPSANNFLNLFTKKLVAIHYDTEEVPLPTFKSSHGCHLKEF